MFMFCTLSDTARQIRAPRDKWNAAAYGADAEDAKHSHGHGAVATKRDPARQSRHVLWHRPVLITKFLVAGGQQLGWFGKLWENTTRAEL